MWRMVEAVCRLRARSMSMDRTSLTGLGMDRLHRILGLDFSNVSERLDMIRTESEDDDRPDRYSHMIPPWAQN